MLLSQFPLTSNKLKTGYAPFHCAAYDYSRADCDGLHDQLGDVPCEDIFKLSASAAPSEICEWVRVGIDVYITHCKYQVKLISMAFSSLCCCHSS